MKEKQTPKIKRKGIGHGGGGVAPPRKKAPGDGALKG